MFSVIIMLATIIFFGVFFTLWGLFRFVVKPRMKYVDAINKLPGPKAYPIIGNAYVFFGIPREEIFTKCTEYTKQYGTLCRDWIGPMAMVHVGNPDHIEHVLKSSVNISKSKVYDSFLPWLGRGILLSTGQKWHEKRKLLTPAFHFQILENFMEVFVEKSEVLLQKLDCCSNGKIFDIYPIVTKCALDIISETAMNVKVNAMTSEENLEYVKAVSALCEIMVIREMKPWLKVCFLPFLPGGKELKRCLSIVHNFTNKVIKERRVTLTSRIRKIEDHFGRKRRVSFLDILLEASDENRKLSDVEIREEVDTFMFEGHHTTSVSICWTLLLLGNNPDIQEKVYDELNSVLQNQKTPLSTKELNELKYLECVIKESLRLYPSVPVVIRKLSEDIYLDGYRIPKSTEVCLQIFDVHHNPEYWDDPNEFDPTRFYPANSVSRHPYSYVPFSAGPRNCIGQRFAMYKEKTVLASILKNYKVRAVDCVDDVKPVFEVILKPVNGIKLVLEKRC